MTARRPKLREHRIRTLLSEILCTVTVVVVLIGTWPVVIAHWGLIPGLLIGWFIAPIAALGAALLVLVWTVPIRGSDVLSLHGRREDEDVGVGAIEAPVAISVIMPVYNARRFLEASLPPLLAMQARGELHEVIVADDGATDGSAEFARGLGARVIASGGRLGPGGARNVAAKDATGDVLWFVDADVVVHDDSAQFVRAAFRRPGVVAVFGSYDDHPPARNFASQYKNLVHHHYHQHADPNAATFWSGCGAVRKEAFIAAGGFDAEAYPVPSIEDIDLGYRLRRSGGLIRLDRHLLSTHLKVWSVGSLVRTDLFGRAVPWARLMLTREEMLDDLNVGTFERLRAAFAALAVLGLCSAAAGLLPWWSIGPILLTLLTGNWHLLALFARRRGFAFALAALVFHQFYYLYSAGAFVACWIEARLDGGRGRSSAVA